MAKKPNNKVTALNEPWWKREGDDCGKQCWSFYVRVADLISSQRLAFFMWRQRYIDLSSSLLGSTGPNVAMLASSYGAGATYNLVNSCTEAVASQTLKDMPRITFASTDARSKTQRRARKLTQYYDGEIDGARISSEAPRAEVDAVYAGTGYVKVMEDLSGDIVVERVFPSDILVDPQWGMMKRPRELAHTYRADLQQLKEAYPDKADVIEGSSSEPIGRAVSARSPTVTLGQTRGVIEAWRLPSGPATEDGKHVVCVSGGILFEEEWKLDFFPVVELRFQEDPLSWWGVGVAQMLFRQQQLVDDMVRTWVTSYRMTAIPRVAMPEGAMISESQFSSGRNILTYKASAGGGKPESLNLPIMGDGAFYTMLEGWKQWAYQYVGVNEGAVNATKPAGVTSGTALQEYRDNQSIRLSQFGNRRDRFYEQVARSVIELTRMRVAREGVSPSAKGAKFLKSIKWSDCSLDRDQYTVASFATNDLPRTPAGRKEYATELAQAGILDRMTLLRVYDQPDVEANERRILSWWERLDRAIEGFYDHQRDPVLCAPDEYLLPKDDPAQCQQVLTVTRQEYNMMLCDEERDEEALALLDQFYRSLQAKMLEYSAPTMGPGQAPGAPTSPQGSPLGQPMAAPQSPALPNAPGT